MSILRTDIRSLWLVLVASASLSCVRLGFEREQPQPQPGHDADAAVVADTGATLDGDHVDRGLDLAVGDAPSPDVATLDSTTGPPGNLICSPPQQVGTSSPTYLSEAALRVDRLELVARDKSNVGYSTKRTSPNHPFGPWSPSELLKGWADPTFFAITNAEFAAVATANTSVARQLAACKIDLSSSYTCGTISIEHKVSGLKVTEDMDGPSVAVLPGSGLLMAHNLTTSSGEVEIYLAQTSNSSSPTQGWVTEPVSVVNQPGVKEDDPALSPDGLVLVYNFPDSNNMGKLWVSERASTSAAFPQPRPLTEVNSTAVEGSAHLAPKNTTAGKKATYELFFSSSRDGNYVIYHSVCNR
jgi:hypothetical protein